LSGPEPSSLVIKISSHPMLAMIALQAIRALTKLVIQIDDIGLVPMGG
jgi:hypothetical protein